MKIAFFDIECASVYKTTAKICAFGYVLCDENFKILAKEDLLINPKGSFHLTDAKGEKGLVLPYKYEDFKKYPDFREVYPKISALLQDDDTAVVGHATYNDVNYLNLETRRFSLPSFNFKYSDTQFIYMMLTGDYTRQCGLKDITDKLGVDFTPHMAADDAYATMKIAEAMCRERGTSLFGLENSLGIERGSIFDYTIKKPTSAAYEKYVLEHRQQKEERTRIRREFYKHLTKKRKRSDGKLKGKIFNFSHALEDDLDLSFKFIDAIYAQGGEYTQKLAHCNAYVCAADDNSERTRSAKHSGTKEILTVEQLTELLK